MNISRATLFSIVAIAFSCGEKESEEPWGQTGTVQGTVYLYNEFGAPEPDQGGAVVTFQSGSSNISVTTGSDGKYVAEDIPMGTYDFIVEKPGFFTRTTRSYRLVGGKSPMYIPTSIARPSTTKVTEVTATISQYISLTGKVSHNFPYSYPHVYYAVFAGTTPDVSPTNYVQSSLYSFDQASGSSFSQTFYLDRTKFASGSTVYIVAYGATTFYAYDASTDTLVYNGLGDTPSNVVSVVVP